jgi:protein O-GlcNAc transferase
MVAEVEKAANDEAAAPDPGREAELVDEVVTILLAAIERHQYGALDEAEAGYRAALEKSPDHPHALHYLGVVHHQRGDHEAAIAIIERAIERLPDFADFHSNLGAARYATGDFAAAEASFRRAIELNPGGAEAHSNLAAALRDQDRPDEAIESFEAARRANPQAPKPLKRLADLYLERERWDEAIESFEAFLDLAPDDAEAHNNLGYALERVNRLKDAADAYQRATELAPTSPEIANNVGSALTRLGRSDEAEIYFQRALHLDPGKWQNMAHMAGMFINRHEFQRAVSIYRVLLAEKPDSTNLYSDLGVALSLDGRLDEANEAFQRALEIDPDNAAALNNLGGNLVAQGDAPAGIDTFKRAIAASPWNIAAHINVGPPLLYEKRYDEAYLYTRALLMLPEYRPAMYTNPHKIFRALADFEAIDELGDLWDNLDQCTGGDFSVNFLEMLAVTGTPAEIDRLADYHKEWGRRLSMRVNLEPLPPAAPRTPRDKLRIGFVSSDLRAHSVSKFMQPLFENYDRDRIEVFCYSPTIEHGDQVQARFMATVDRFTFVDNRSDREVAGIVRDDEIDILIDLHGFTRNHKLTMMALKPAPVQIAWLGYPFTTGVPEIDYVLVDPLCRPLNDDWLTETPLEMPESWVCFGSFPDVPISAELPFERNDGNITFGTMNNPYKFTRQVIDCWARVMREVEGSRFIIVRPECSSMTFRKNFAGEFERRGITPERIFFVNNQAHGLMNLHYYDEMDITLDTFPVAGGTTTCDAMWMGVPVVAMVGPSMHQRLGYSLLTNGGMGDLCVETEDEFVAVAVELADAHDLLRQVRHTQRQALQQSPLCDAPRFTRNFEALMFEVAARHSLR